KKKKKKNPPPPPPRGGGGGGFFFFFFLKRGGRTSSGSSDSFRSETGYWLGALPRDGRLVVTVGWPAAGLAEATTVLHLDPLDDLAHRVVTLL
ncbi:hypothetical protein A7K94_0218660, partial [Modestobacter sp. VKM Ac-2676]